MIRLETIRKFRCPFGICIALSILVVIGCDFFCKLDLISFSFQKPQTVAAPSAHTHEGAHHGEKDHHHDHGTAANHEASEEGGCCNNLTQQFYSSLINSANAQIEEYLQRTSFRSIDNFAPPRYNKKVWTIKSGGQKERYILWT